MKSLIHHSNGQRRIFKGEVHCSGLEGASEMTYFGDLTGKQPCKPMHNNHNEV